MYVGLPNPNVLVPLKKLHIHKVNPSTPDPYQNNDFDVLYNPESYVQKREVQYSEKTGLSMDSPITQFAHGNAETLTFSLFFDSMSSGSEVGGSIADKAKFAGNSMLPSAGKLIDVRTYTQKVYNLMEIDVNLHVPPLLELTWGSLSFTSHLISCQQSFTRFNELGNPVRAWLECTFRQFISNTGSKSLRSPDTTKYRTLHQGDSLWALSAREYGEAGRWREIARANEIENPRLLRSGETVVLPALK